MSLDPNILTLIQTLLAVLGGGGVVGTASYVFRKIRSRVYVKLVSDKSDPDIDSFVELYNEVIDECARIAPEEIIKFIGNHEPEPGLPLCDYLFLCKSGEQLLGFLKVIYCTENNFLFIAYLGIDKSIGQARKKAVNCLFSHLGRFIEKSLNDCKAILFEVALQEKQSRLSPTAKIRAFKTSVERLNLPCYQVGINYIQPEMPTDCGSLEEEQTTLLYTLFNQWKPSGSLSLRTKYIQKADLMRFLEFIYMRIYGRVYSDDPELNQVYRDYLSDLINKYDSELPSRIALL
jgi:hypothetical protein